MGRSPHPLRPRSERLAAAGEYGDEAIEDYLHAMTKIDAERGRIKAMQTACADERR